jgi:hypothetical protein
LQCKQKAKKRNNMMENGSAIIPSAVPAASAVEHGTIDDIRDEYDSAEDDSFAAENPLSDILPQPDHDQPNTMKTTLAPDSPKSFNSDDIFDDVDVELADDDNNNERITDQDLDRLLGPLPSRRGNNNTQQQQVGSSSLEVDDGNNSMNDNNDDWSREKKNRKPPPLSFCPCCPGNIRRGPLLLPTTTKIGNVFILSPRCYNQYGFGIIGPHWFGPICCLGLETIATMYYYPMAKYNVGTISAMICLAFYLVGIISLCFVACSDPGIVKSVRGGGIDGRGGLDGIGVGRNGYAGVPGSDNNDITARAGWRFCDLCSVYQPPDAVHCPECNVCIEGYDHHCPWMGQCIGKKNFTPFMIFNCSWLFYLLYSCKSLKVLIVLSLRSKTHTILFAPVIWVTFIGQVGNANSYPTPPIEFEGGGNWP